MNDYITEENIAAHEHRIDNFHGLEELEHSLATLIENYKLLRNEKRELEFRHSSLQERYDELYEKQTKTEARIRGLLEKLAQLEV